MGTFAPGASLGLLWETYALGAAAGDAHYGFTLTIRRERGTAGRVTARVLGAIASVAGVESRADEVTISFDRRVAHAATVAEYVELALGDTPAGRYRLSLTITDRSNGRSATGTRVFTIR